MTRPFMPHRYKSPCYECQKREVGCHGRCDDYKEYAKKEADYRRDRYKKDKCYIERR